MTRSSRARSALLATLTLAPLSAHAQGTPLTERDAIEYARKALEAAKRGDVEACVVEDRRSLEQQENARTRIHLSGCESKAGHLLDALRDAQAALKEGIAANDVALMKIARQRVLDLVPRLPKVTFTRPAGVQDLVVTFDERPVPAASLTNKFTIDPGKHVVHAEGSSNGLRLVYDEAFTVQEGQLLTVDITLRDAVTPGVLSADEIRCMVNAKTQHDVLKCIPPNIRMIVVRAGLDLAGYTDTTHVHVATPTVRGSITSPTAGWNVGGSYTVDFVTAASPDIVSTASPRYRERRHVVALTGGYKPATIGAQAYGNVSSEPDYLSLSAGAAVSADLADKLVTPRLGYTHSDDTIGRSDTPFSIWHRKLATDEVEASCTFVMSPTMVLLVGGTYGRERGDQSKPYRFVPVFDDVTAAKVAQSPGAPADIVNVVRGAPRPAEQLPLARDRYALGARVAKRLGDTTVRLEERLYADTWGVMASSTDGRWMLDLAPRVRVWPHARFHVQGRASFYRMAYTAHWTAGGLDLPSFRTTDRELSTMQTVTGGGGARFAITRGGATEVGITVTGDAMFSRYLESLFIDRRTALYGVVALDAEF